MIALNKVALTMVCKVMKKIINISTVRLFIRVFIICAFYLPFSLTSLHAASFSALAAYEEQGSAIESTSNSQATLIIHLSQSIPYRVFTLTQPNRLVIDFAEMDWNGFDARKFIRSDFIENVRVGKFTSGWSRMVLDLKEPLLLMQSELSRTANGARLHMQLQKTDFQEFFEQSNVERADINLALNGVEGSVAPPLKAPLGNRAIRVMLDPGHGGIDPGARNGSVKESVLMLQFARELKEVLLRSDRFDVAMTREKDQYVGLEERISKANAFNADVFMSLHADALAQGQARGATVYTLSETASDEASRKLAQRHDRDAILAGVALKRQDDAVVKLLVDMSRRENEPRNLRLAHSMVQHLSSSIGTYKRPHLQANFSVLKSADVPSILVELGFLSSALDRDKMLTSAWRLKAATALRAALLDWEHKEIAAYEQRLK